MSDKRQLLIDFATYWNNTTSTFINEKQIDDFLSGREEREAERYDHVKELRKILQETPREEIIKLIREISAGARNSNNTGQ